MPAVITFAAWSNTGKTTYLEKLIPCLKDMGLRVAVVKHDAHEIQLDACGKDSWRLARAGADAVAVASGSQFALLEHRPLELSEVIRRLPEADLVLTEGYKNGPYPKIALYRSTSGKPLAVPPENCLAIVSDTSFEAPCPVFPLDDPQPLAVFLRQRLIRKEGDPLDGDLS
jgi:molybdopterin-guanine dinucleotide biosynthesis protein MobB